MERFKQVWCPNCNKKVKYQFDVMEADTRNKNAAADIVCDECHLIVATLHEKAA